MATVRRTIRIKAFQALFQLANNLHMTEGQAIQYAITYPLNRESDEVDELQALKEILPSKKSLSDEDIQNNLDYLKDLVSGVREQQDFLDEKITENLSNWTIQRVETTNLLILRLATYELYFHEETDPRIVINEAIELTKSFNNQNASKFVNGVLQGILDAKEA